MTAPVVRADHEALGRAAQSFGREAGQTRDSVQRLRQQLEVLQGGDWIGRGATAFYQEMSSDVLPTLARLMRALEAGNQTVLQISRLMREAESEAARLLRGEGEGQRAGAGGGAGSAAGGAGAGAGGASGVTGGAGGAGGAPAVERSLLDVIREKAELKTDGKIFEIQRKSGGAFSPELGFKYGVEGSVFGDAKASDGFAFLGGGAGVGAGISGEGPSLGAYGEIYAVKGQGDILFAGDKDLGFTGAGEVKGLAGEGFIGVKDGSVGASLGGTLVSAKGELGANVAGYNVGVNAEVGLKAEIGVRIGKHTEIKLPFVTIGFSFGGARE